MGQLLTISKLIRIAYSILKSAWSKLLCYRNTNHGSHNGYITYSVQEYHLQHNTVTPNIIALGLLLRSEIVMRILNIYVCITHALHNVLAKCYCVHSIWTSKIKVWQASNCLSYLKINQFSKKKNATICVHGFIQDCYCPGTLAREQC